MTRDELAKELRQPASWMMGAAGALAVYGGSDEVVKHASELKSAAQIVWQWADELAKDEQK